MNTLLNQKKEIKILTPVLAPHIKRYAPMPQRAYHSVASFTYGNHNHTHYHLTTKKGAPQFMPSLHTFKVKQFAMT